MTAAIRRIGLASLLMISSLACLANASTIKVLYTFSGGSDGGYSQAGLLYENGLLYGTTQFGGMSNDGTVFSVNASTGAETVLHSFKGGTTQCEGGGGGPDGCLPYAGLIYASGKLYGTTGLGGSSGYGTVFSVNASTGAEKILHSFSGSPDGAGPHAGLLSHSGTLYGTTVSGGDIGPLNPEAGTVFAISPATGTETSLYSFAAGEDGSGPHSGLIYVGGTLYGTTVNGGANAGTVFRLSLTTGSESVLYRFQGQPDGNAPYAGLVYAGGFLYGTTSSGGGQNQGTVFKIDPSTGVETLLYSFTGGTDGGVPYAGLIYDGGALYGTTYSGGASGQGTLFKVSPRTGAETVLHSFGGTDGILPKGTLIYVGGAFYGTTSAGGQLSNGSGGAGTVFVFTP